MTCLQIYTFICVKNKLHFNSLGILWRSHFLLIRLQKDIFPTIWLTSRQKNKLRAKKDIITLFLSYAIINPSKLSQAVVFKNYVKPQWFYHQRTWQHFRERHCPWCGWQMHGQRRLEMLHKHNRPQVYKSVCLWLSFKIVIFQFYSIFSSNNLQRKWRFKI